MARMPELIAPTDLGREHLLTIPGVGARNIGHVQHAYADFLETRQPISALTPLNFAESGVVSLDTAEEIVDWIQRHVEDTYVQGELFEFEEEEEEAETAEEEEVVWDDEGPLFALNFHPLKAIEEAASLLPEDSATRLRLTAVAGWLRGEVAPFQKGAAA